MAKANRNGETFLCQKCGYQANADFNAAVNIAKKAILQEAKCPLQKPIQPCAEKVGEVSTPRGSYTPEASMILIGKEANVKESRMRRKVNYKKAMNGQTTAKTHRLQ